MRRNRFLTLPWLLTAAAILFAPQCLSEVPQPLTVQEIYSNPALRSRGLQSATWAAGGGRLLYRREAQETNSPKFFAFDTATRKERVHLDPQDVVEKLKAKLPAGQNEEKIAPAVYQFSAGGETALIRFRGDLFEYSINGGTLRQLTQSAPAESDESYSPDGARVAFVRDHSVWVLDRASGRAKMVTAAGTAERTFGSVDWVIGEELDLAQGYWWSPDSKKLVILALDERKVPRYPVVDWMPTHPTTERQYYPKAGDPNPVASLFFWDDSRGRAREIPLDIPGEFYIPSVQWLPDSSKILVQVLTRDQKSLRLLLADPATGVSKVVLEENDPSFVNVSDMLYAFKSRPEILWGSERSGWLHLYRYSLDGRCLGPATSGEWAVTSLNAVDEAAGKIYFTSTEKSPLERHIYVADLAGGRPRRLTGADGTYVGLFSPDCKWVMQTYSNDSTPPVYSVGEANALGGAAEIARTDTELLKGLKLLDWEYASVPGADGAALPARMLKPAGFDPSGKYPVIVYVYGGPHAQVVSRSWQGTYTLWHQMMARQGFVVFSLDNRGSAAMGKRWESAVYRKLGQKELEDQLAGVSWLKGRPWVDGRRIGIWGWSYGGYMALYSLLKAPGTFAAGVSVAPVTDWANYDSIYTERYMDRPADNPLGYIEGSAVRAAENLRDPLLLVHGTSDDNVHLQNSLQMVDALVAKNRKFQLLYYPRMGHGIAAKPSRIHLFEAITEFFLLHLKPGGQPSPKAAP